MEKVEGTLTAMSFLDLILDSVKKETATRSGLNAEAHADITWWRTFLPTWNGTAKFIDPNSVLAVDMLLYTDASGSYGSGAYCQGGWFFHAWQPVERAVCHCGSSFDMETPMAWKTGKIYV